MDEYKALLDDIGIRGREGTESKDGYYVIELTNYEDFNRIYNILDKSLEVIQDSENSFVKDDEVHVQYDKDEFILELVGLLDEDDYTLNIIKED